MPVGATIHVGDSFVPMAEVLAIDKEDGDLTSKIKVDGEVDTTKSRYLRINVHGYRF